MSAKSSRREGGGRGRVAREGWEKKKNLHNATPISLCFMCVSKDYSDETGHMVSAVRFTVGRLLCGSTCIPPVQSDYEAIKIVKNCNNTPGWDVSFQLALNLMYEVGFMGFLRGTDASLFLYCISWLVKHLWSVKRKLIGFFIDSQQKIAIIYQWGGWHDL